MKATRALSIIMILLAAGCASSEVFVSKAVRQSKAYHHVLARSSHPAFVVEAKHPSHAIVALGEAPELVLKRLYTLRVSWSGKVEQLYVDMHGGRSWIPDK